MTAGLPSDLVHVAGLLAESSDPAARRIAEGLRRYLSGEAATLDEALDQRGPGQRRAATVHRVAERDRHLREGATRFSLSAADLAARLARFEATTWLRYRTREEVPTQLAGRLEEHLFLALQAWPRAPKERQLRAILDRQ